MASCGVGKKPSCPDLDRNIEWLTQNRESAWKANLSAHVKGRAEAPDARLLAHMSQKPSTSILCLRAAA